MPQLDLATFPMQLFWLAIVFVAFFFVLRTFALPQLGKVMGRRTKKIDSDLAAAAEAHQKAEQLRQEFTERMEKAQREVEEKFAQTHNELRELLSSREAHVMTELAARAHEAERFIAGKRDAALAELQKLAPPMVALAAERLTGVPPNSAEVDLATTTAMQQVKAFHNSTSQ